MELQEGVGNVMLDPMGWLLMASHSQPSSMPNKLLRRLLLSSVWQRYQRGHFGLHEAAQQLAQLPFLSPTHWSPHSITVMLQNRTFSPAPGMLQLLDVLRMQLRLRLFCVCNASAEELHVLRHQFPDLCGKFSAIFTSGEEGVGKPSQRFLQIAMQKAGILAHRTVYLDSHDLESIVAARSLGMHALLVKPVPTHDTSQLGQLHGALIRDILLAFNYPSTLQHNLSRSPTLQYSHLPPPDLDLKLQYLLSLSLQTSATPILSLPTTGCWSATLASARQFLLENGAHDPDNLIRHASLTSDGIRISDNFAQFLIADLLDDARFLPMGSPPASGLICFINKNSYTMDNNKGTMCFGSNVHLDCTSDAFTLKDIPEDLDTTSIGLSVLHKFGKVALETIHQVLDKMLKYVSNDDGILQVYFDLERPRIDPVVITNAIFLFHLAQRGHEVEKSERFVESVLLHRAYKDGTLYYNLGEAFLVSVARLVHRFDDHFRRNGMKGLLVARLQEELQRKERGSLQEREGNVMALVMFMRACTLCGLEEDVQAKEEVVRMQKGNGSWDAHAYCRNGSNAQSWVGNEGLTTAYAYVNLLAPSKIFGMLCPSLPLSMREEARERERESMYIDLSNGDKSGM